MKRENRTESELNLRLRLVSKLYYVDQLGQTEVAEIVGCSSSQVSRLIAQAREKGIVKISVEEYAPFASALEGQLKQALNLKRVLVIRTTKGSDPASIRRTVGYFAAPLVSEWIHPNAVVGVGVSRTLHELCRHVERQDGSNGITVVQLIGNVGAARSDFDSLGLGHTLSERLHATFFSLNAPAYAEDARSRALLLNHTDLRSVYKIFDTIQIALVGVGTLTNSNLIERGIISESDIRQLQQKGVVGDTCGRFYDSNGQECRTAYRDRVISISLEELRQIPNVVAVTYGAYRADAVYAAAKGGLIKSLVIDEEGAEALLERVKRD